MSASSERPPDRVSPLLVVSDVAARLVRRGLLAPDAAADRWRRARVFVFRHGPVVCDPPAGTWDVSDVTRGRTR